MSDTSKAKHIAYFEIKLLLDYSQRLYDEYLKSDKKFIYALILRKVNGRLYERIADSAMYFKGGNHVDALELMLHLDVWMSIWDCECKEKKPQLSDVFAFQSNNKFPTDSVEKLLLGLAASSE